MMRMEAGSRLAALLPLGVLVGAAAAPPAAPSPVVRYLVRPGDTVDGLAAYLARPGAFRRLVPGGRLRAGEVLDIPLAWARSVPVVARIRSFRGAVRIEGAAPPRVGGTLGEGTRVVTGADASVSLVLPDRSVVTLPSLSAIRLMRLRHVPLTGTYDRQFVLETGRSEYQVTPNHRAGSRFEIRTPVSVAAVRGTVFRVSMPEADGANAEVLRGDVAVTGQGPAGAGQGAGLDLPKGFGAHSDRVSAGHPVRLLPPPRILDVATTQLGSETVVLRAVPGARRYRVQLASDRDFTDILAETEGESPTLAIPPTREGVYNLRATALDGQGLEGLPDMVVYYHDMENGRQPGRK